MKYRKFLLLTLAIGLSVAQVRAETPPANSISVEHPWARATPTGARTAAAYVRIVNHGSTVDHLVAARRRWRRRSSFIRRAMTTV